MYRSRFWTIERNKLHSLSFVRSICVCFDRLTGFVDIKKFIERLSLFLISTDLLNAFIILSSLTGV